MIKKSDLLYRIEQLEMKIKMLNNYVEKNLDITVGYEEREESYHPYLVYAPKITVPIKVSIKEFIEQLIKDDIVSVEITPERKEERKISIKCKKD